MVHQFYRFAQTTGGNLTSTSRPIKNGISQGVILSPFLFNLFAHNLVQPAAPNIKVGSYADDLTITSHHSKHTQTAQSLQIYLNSQELWLTLTE